MSISLCIPCVQPAADKMDTRVEVDERIESIRKVTVTLSEETARWVRLEAARRGISVSGLIRQLLTDRMGRQVAYESAKTRYLSRRGSPLTQDARYPGRADLHDRAGPL